MKIIATRVSRLAIRSQWNEHGCLVYVVSFHESPASLTKHRTFSAAYRQLRDIQELSKDRQNAPSFLR